MPEGEDALTASPVSSTMVASTVGSPRESSTKSAWIWRIVVIGGSEQLQKSQKDLEDLQVAVALPLRQPGARQRPGGTTPETFRRDVPGLFLPYVGPLVPLWRVLHLRGMRPKP